MNQELKNHWEHIYETKTPEQVSWTENVPRTSLEMIASAGLDKTAAIIDIGGGDSHLADFLLNKGYTDITVLDISAAALEKAKERLGDKAGKIKWIVADITEFKPQRSYDIWHDRACFHFLTQQEQIDKYVALTGKAAKNFMAIGTFSTEGPLRCSALDIHQYNEKTLTGTFNKDFEHINCFTGDHETPFGTKQNFLFCTFKRRPGA